MALAVACATRETSFTRSVFNVQVAEVERAHGDDNGAPHAADAQRQTGQCDPHPTAMRCDATEQSEEEDVMKEYRRLSEL